jgi:hypothetical protein
MVRTVTRKTPSAATTWYRIGKSANTGIKRSSSSRRKELVKLRSMKKVTKRVLEEKLKRAYLRDGMRWTGESSMTSRRPIRLKRLPNGEIIRLSSRSSPSSSSSSTVKCPVCFKNTSSGNLCDIELNIIHPLCRECFNRITEGNNKCPLCRRHINRLVNLPTETDGACPPGKTRSRKGHCVKIWSRSPRRKSLNPGYELNRQTGRLRKVCPSGKKRSRKGHCVKI